MSATTVPDATAAAAHTDTRLPSLITAATPARVASFAAVVIIALFVLPGVLSAFWLKIAYEMAAYSLVTLGLGLLVGRTGMYSLCQIPMVAAGAWFSLRLYYAFGGEVGQSTMSGWWFPLLILATGLLTGLLGVVIGLPALRLSGLYLALITLMAAGAITLLLTVFKFPNGGGGFWGFDTRVASGQNLLPRPAIADSDVAFYRYVVIVAAIGFLIAAWHITGKPGRAWASIRQSQVTAVAAGVNTTLYKLWAFALSAAVTGMAGALIAAGSGVTTNQFPVEQSIILLAVVLLGGVYNLWGALVAAFFLRVFPQILDKKLGLPVELLTVLFGVGVMQVLIVQPKGVVEDLRRLGAFIGGLFWRRSRNAEPGPAPEVTA